MTLEAVLIHIEVRYRSDDTLAEHMFIYHRVLDRYDRKIAGLPAPRR